MSGPRKWTDDEKAKVKHLAGLGKTPTEIGLAVGRHANAIYHLRTRHPELWEREQAGFAPLTSCEYPHYRNTANVSLRLTSIQQEAC